MKKKIIKRIGLFLIPLVMFLQYLQTMEETAQPELFFGEKVVVFLQVLIQQVELS